MVDSRAHSLLLQSPNPPNPPSSLYFAQVESQTKENTGEITLGEAWSGRICEGKDSNCAYLLGQVQASDASKAEDWGVPLTEEADDVWLAADSLNPENPLILVKIARKTGNFDAFLPVFGAKLHLFLVK